MLLKTGRDLKVLLSPIRTEKDYDEAILNLEDIMEEENKENDGIITALSILIDEYEKKHYEIEAPDPIEAIKYIMSEMGLSQKHLTQYLGSKSLVSQILNKKRKLSITNIRVLSVALNIPIEILIQDYELDTSKLNKQSA